MKKFFIILFLLDFILVLYLVLNKESIYLLNTQIALIASLFITSGSFFGYKKLVLKRLKNYENSEDRDAIDKIEDPYELYSEVKNEKEIDAKELFEEEKKRIKGFKRSILNFVSTSSAFLSIYRVLGYIVLIVSVLVLMDKKIFDPIYFFIGLSIVPISALIFMISKR